jgi:DNA adenine methylase
VPSGFTDVLSRAEAGDLVFFDPPYVPISETSSFTTYSKDGFGSEQQRRLSDVFRDLAERGCNVMLSNSDCPFLRELYADWRTVQVSASRNINSRASKRGAVSEVLVLSW